jgi:hypothetical protein
MMLRIHEPKYGDFNNNSNKKSTLSNNDEINTRWKEICQKIRVDPNLDEQKNQQFWKLLKCYQDVFAWNKGELVCCTIGKHVVDSHLARCLLIDCHTWKRQK